MSAIPMLFAASLVMRYYFKPPLKIFVLYSSQKNNENPPHLSAYQLPSPCVPSVSRTKCHICSCTLSISLSLSLSLSLSVCAFSLLLVLTERRCTAQESSYPVRIPTVYVHSFPDPTVSWYNIWSVFHSLFLFTVYSIQFETQPCS
jgi:hypothetical protein